MAEPAEKITGETLSEQMAGVFSTWRIEDLPQSARDIAIKDLIDMAGLCVSARDTEYVRQLVTGWDSDGPCTAIGHTRRLDAAGAAVVNGTATHGEDFDDTLEGAPIRVGAMVIPAVLAAGERFGLSGAQVLTGIIAGMEAVCRINHVAAGHMHRNNFHPVSVVGTLGAAMGAGTAMGLGKRELAMAVGIAGSFSSGILEYLTDGAWTKRLHPGWAAQSGLRAAVIARTGFFGPRTVLEGGHNFFKAFAPTATPDYSHLTRGLGQEFYMERVVFKPYACGTMIHPYIDCAIRLREHDITAEQIESILCPTGEGLVHRLWEPLSAKHAPPSGYAAKFSMPYCMAVGFLEGDAGLAQFTDEKARDPRILKLARKISYRIDPENEYPRNYSGHMRVTLTDGRQIALDQPHMRGGVHEPLPLEAIIAKFHGNIAHGGWPAARGEALLHHIRNIPQHTDMTGLSAFGAD
ncbi:MmgE/PrpD family protein [Alkalilacustris brevis]|uniref:MmgE/PrpD family protein n=1 Tax=Alkalilacustris brevis TaxID=2026338 RepID=UPI00192E6427|nr:MmgE/PrpD family protein [Alkalilacustris brevis]